METEFFNISNLLKANAGVVVAMATVAIAIMAYLTWRVTRKLAQENRLLRKAETEPKVIAYLAVHPQYPRYTNFILANVGRGAARNVKFNFNSDMDETNLKKFGIEFWNSNKRTAISFLPQGEKMSVPIGPNLLSEPLCPAFEVSIEYQNMKSQHLHETCRLDISQFDGFSIIGDPPEQTMAGALEKIAIFLGHFSSGHHRLKVETMTADEVHKKTQKFIDSLKKENPNNHTATDEDDS